MSLDLLTSGLEMVLTTNLDIKDCNYGLLGTIYQLGWVIQQGYSANYGQATDCDFRSYWFEKRPLVHIKADDFLKETIKSVIPETCLNKKGLAWEN